MAEQLIVDYRSAKLSERQRRLCDFAIKLTLRPQSMDDSDTQNLRDVGLSDDEILMAVQVIGYFNYINRVAEGLHVDLEDWMRPRSQPAWELERGKDYLSD